MKTIEELLKDLANGFSYIEFAYSDLYNDENKETFLITNSINKERLHNCIYILTTFDFTLFFRLIDKELLLLNESQKMEYINNIYRDIYSYECYVFGSQVYLPHQHIKKLLMITSYSELISLPLDENNHYLFRSKQTLDVFKNWYNSKKAELLPTSDKYNGISNERSNHQRLHSDETITKWYEQLVEKGYISGDLKTFRSLVDKNTAEVGEPLEWKKMAVKKNGRAKKTLTELLHLMGYENNKEIIEAAEQYFRVTLNYASFSKVKSRNYKEIEDIIK